MDIWLECGSCFQTIRKIASNEDSVTMTIGVFDDYICSHCGETEDLRLIAVVHQPQIVEAQKGAN